MRSANPRDETKCISLHRASLYARSNKMELSQSNFDRNRDAGWSSLGGFGALRIAEKQLEAGARGRNNRYG